MTFTLKTNVKRYTNKSFIGEGNKTPISLGFRKKRMTFTCKAESQIWSTLFNFNFGAQRQMCCVGQCRYFKGFVKCTDKSMVPVVANLYQTSICTPHTPDTCLLFWAPPSTFCFQLPLQNFKAKHLGLFYLPNPAKLQTESQEMNPLEEEKALIWFDLCFFLVLFPFIFSFLFFFKFFWTELANNNKKGHRPGLLPGKCGLAHLFWNFASLGPTNFFSRSDGLVRSVMYGIGKQIVGGFICTLPYWTTVD